MAEDNGKRVTVDFNAAHAARIEKLKSMLEEERGYAATYSDVLRKLVAEAAL